MTEVLVFSHGVSSGSSSVDLGPLAQHIKPAVTNFGVKMDCNLTDTENSPKKLPNTLNNESKQI